MLTTYYLLLRPYYLDVDTLYWLVHTHTFQCVIFYWRLLPIGVDRRDCRRNILDNRHGVVKHIQLHIILASLGNLPVILLTIFIYANSLGGICCIAYIDVRIIASKLVDYYLQLTFLQVSSGSINHWVGSILSQYDRLF